MCLKCPDGTWMGDSFHRGTREHCTPAPGFEAPPPSASDAVSYSSAAPAPPGLLATLYQQHEEEGRGAIGGLGQLDVTREGDGLGK